MAIIPLNTDPGRLSDEELVSRFAKTKEQAYFEELYNRYIHLAYGVCLKMLKNQDDSQDVVSEVFKILYIKLPTANVKSFKSYLYAVARNESIAKLRQRKTEMTKMADWQYTENFSGDFMENEGLIAQLDNTPSVESQVEKAVGELNDDQRLCVRLFFYEDKSYKEIATQTGYSEKQVKSYLQNGKRNLRIILEKTLRKHTA
jgi:RNA polymerase sigma-70 factor (ECF subfamily)